MKKGLYVNVIPEGDIIIFRGPACKYARRVARKIKIKNMIVNKSANAVADTNISKTKLRNKCF